jgi:Icc-related predicted phosphoesterase
MNYIFEKSIMFLEKARFLAFFVIQFFNMKGSAIMVFLTGDIHGDPTRVIEFYKKSGFSDSDIIIILGDVGANYYSGSRDALVKSMLNGIGVDVLCIHGNHEMRPANIPSYHLTEWNGGKVWIEDEYPHLLFAKDGEIYSIEGNRYIAIGGAYSVDKYYRLAMNYGWWEDEQPSDEIKQYVEKQLEENEINIVLSHTCPLKYEPTEVFLSQVDQSKVDKSTEIWLDKIEDNLKYMAWFCGHWHTDKRIDKMHFLFEGWDAVKN